METRKFRFLNLLPTSGCNMLTSPHIPSNYCKVIYINLGEPEDWQDEWGTWVDEHVVYLHAKPIKIHEFGVVASLCGDKHLIPWEMWKHGERVED
jgi:hypothetical protein